jgi:hypothetical protein
MTDPKYLAAIAQLSQTHNVVFNSKLTDLLSHYDTYHKYFIEHHIYCATTDLSWNYDGGDYMSMKIPKWNGSEWTWYFGCENQGVYGYIAKYREASDEPMILLEWDDTEPDEFTLHEFLESRSMPRPRTRSPSSESDEI